MDDTLYSAYTKYVLDFSTLPEASDIVLRVFVGEFPILQNARVISESGRRHALTYGFICVCMCCPFISSHHSAAIELGRT